MPRLASAGEFMPYGYVIIAITDHTLCRCRSHKLRELQKQQYCVYSQCLSTQIKAKVGLSDRFIRCSCGLMCTWRHNVLVMSAVSVYIKFRFVDLTMQCLQ